MDNANPSSRRKAGFTLLELSISIVMIILLGLGVFVLVRTVQSSVRVSTEKDHAMSIKACLTGNFGGDFRGVSNTTAKDAGCIPQDMIRAGGEEKSAWGGDVSIMQDGGNPGVYYIIYYSTPKDICKKLMPAVLVPFDTVYFNGQGVNLQMGKAAMQTACEISGTNAFWIVGN